MKRLLIGLGAIVFTVVAAALIVPFFLPKETIKNEIVAQVEAATGWRLRIDGPVSLSLLPGFNLSARDVGLSGEAGADGIEFVKIREIDFSLALSALIGGEARITGITLVEPRILLEVDKSGRTSWAPRRILPHQLSGADPLAGVLAEADGEPAPAVGDAPVSDGSGAAAILRRVRLDALTLKDGALAWSDLRSGAHHEVLAVNATVAMPSLDGTATLEGTLDWQGVLLRLVGDVAQPLAMAQGNPSDLRLTVSNDFATVRLAGNLTSAPLGGSFALDADGGSLADLLAALKIPATGMTGLDAFAVKAMADVSATRVTISQMSAALGDTILKGTLEADTSREKPQVTGNLAIAQIDLDRFRAPVPRGDAAAPDAAPDAAPEPAAKPGSKPASGPLTPAASSPIDLSALAALDANIALKIGKLSGAGVEVRNVDLSAVIQNGLLAVDLADLKAFGGSGGFVVNAHQRNERAVIAGTIRSENIDLAQVMAFAGRKEALTGDLMSRLSYASEGSTSSALFGNLELQGSVKLASGSYTGLGLEDALDAAADRIDKVDVEVTIAGLDQPVKAKGGLNWRGERFKLAATASPATLMIGKTLPIEATLKGKRVTAGVKGAAALDGSFDGRVSLETPSLRGLLAWIGQPLGPGGGLERFAVSGRFAASPRALTFKDTVVSLDGTSGRGEGRVNLAGARPAVEASLTLDQLVLDPYLGAGGGKDGAAAAGGAGQSAGAGGWGTAPIDFSGLKGVDADLDITSKGITWDKVKIGASKLKIVLKGGLLSADLNELALYEGKAIGRVVLDGQAAVPRVEARAKLTGISAYPLLRDAAGFNWIEGAAAIDLDVKTSGRSQAQLVAALAGTAGTTFTDGAIRGVNIPQMMRGLSVQTLLGWQSAKAEKTDFSELSGSFKIENGIARNTDLKMVGPLVRISGGGTTDMPRQYLDWRVEPKVVASLKGQGAGDGKLAGLGVPVVIRGPWAKPKIYPDIAGILENPDAAYKELQKLGGGLVSALKKDPAKAVDEVLKQVTGGSIGGIDVQKVIDGEADDEAVLRAIEEGFNLPSGIFGLGKKK